MKLTGKQEAFAVGLVCYRTMSNFSTAGLPA
jgi:hypothetical protein